MSVPVLLLETLENLSNENLEKFKWHLKHDDLAKVADLEKAKATNTVDLMLARHGPEGAMMITLKILRQMKEIYLAGQLEDKQKGKKSNTIYTKQLWKGPPSTDFTVSSDCTRAARSELLKLNTWKYNKETMKKPSMQLASANFDLVNTINMIDTVDRPGVARAEGIYAGTGAYAKCPQNKPGERVPKAGAYAEAGVGRVHAEFSVFEAEAKGPNAVACAEANVIGANAMARAEVGSASAKAGPLGVKVGLGLDTGVSISPLGAEFKFLGCGFSIGPKTSLSLLGSEVSCSVM